MQAATLSGTRGGRLCLAASKGETAKMNCKWMLLITLAIGGCAGAEPPLTKLNVLSNKDFTFEARANLEYPENDPKAEATRISWLEQALADRHLCPNGYTITGRTLVAAEEEELGQTHNVAYHGVCK